MESNLLTGALNVAVAAARDAGKIITRQITQLDRINIEQKSTTEFVTDADIMAEQIIIEQLEKNFPEHNIIAEENGNQNKDSEFSWVIDPIDGTHNFMHSHPHCCTSIALMKDGQPMLAVVYDPFRNELFTAIKGRGAQLDGRRIRVSSRSKLAESMLCTGFPYRDMDEIKPWLKTFAIVLPRAQNIHRTGSSVLDFAYVACGRYDGFWEFGMKQWDIAAGALLVSEAGGLITDVSGNTDYFKSGDVIAGNPKVHEKLTYLITNT